MKKIKKDKEEILEVSYIENMLDWFVYTILSFLLFIPFFWGYMV
jgi:hypothetical protein